MHKLLTRAALLGLAGCRTLEFDCADQQAQLTLVGFTPVEVATLVLQRYAANTAFGTPLDSVALTAPAPQYWRHDTLSFSPGQQGLPLVAGYDYRLRLPALRRAVSITQFEGEHKTGSCSVSFLAPDRRGCTCQNELRSARLDGRPVTFPFSTRFGYAFFISR